MKFDMHEFWKHEECRDVFFKPTSIAFDDNGKDAILHGSWLTQGVERWFFIFVPRARIKIPPHQYDRWKPYAPRGVIKL